MAILITYHHFEMVPIFPPVTYSPNRFRQFPSYLKVVLLKLEAICFLHLRKSFVHSSPWSNSAKTPSCKSNQEREPQNVKFELASLAVRLPPPPSAKTLPPKADLDISLSSDSSEELLPQDTMEKVGYASTCNSSMCRCFRNICMCAV